MASIGDTTRPAFAYDQATDTWVPVGIGPHSHTAAGVGAVATSSFAAKGDLVAGTGAGTLSNLGVGANNTVLTADSTTATGMKWATAGGGSLKELAFTSSNASWTIPAGVTQIWALLIGSGGGGGGCISGGNVGGGGGGAGQVLEAWFTISGDTTLNITVPAGGAGGADTGAVGSNGSSATIVGNTSSTIYASAAGGGGGGGSQSVSGLSGASGGGNGINGGTNHGAVVLSQHLSQYESRLVHYLHLQHTRRSGHVMQSHRLVD